MKKAKPELVKLKQGIRLMEFYISHNFKSRSKFARFIGVSSSSINEVIWNHKPISEDLFLRIKLKFPEVDEDWLRNGKDLKLLTNQPDPLEQETLNESHNAYQINCINCFKKDKEIEKVKSELMDLQKQYIECLKEVSGFKNIASG